MNIREEIEKGLTRRAEMIVREIGPYFLSKKRFSCFIAGGCLGEHINDVDMFPLEPIPEPKKLKRASLTKNASTYTGARWPIQICTYKHSTLHELVGSFDYAHIQAGATVRLGGKIPQVEQVEFTDDWISARALKTSWFTGSNYPLSSILRAAKYFKSEAIGRSAHIRCIIDALNATISRGFKDYNDFKDQLDAIDLGFTPEQLDEVGKAKLMDLFNHLRLDEPQNR